MGRKAQRGGEIKTEDAAKNRIPDDFAGSINPFDSAMYKLNLFLC